MAQTPDRLNDVSVDPLTGSFSVGGVVVFAPDNALVKIAPSDVLQVWSVRNVSTGYVWRDFVGALFAGRPCMLSVCDLDGIIQEIIINFRRARDDEEIWVDQAEVRREVELGRVTLSRMLSRPFNGWPEQFPWGAAVAVYDDRSGGVPRIALVYKR